MNSDYEKLNPRQKEAVCYTDGPLLILAGAGSGKTKVLTHRVAYLIEEKNVNPWNILAITFTNKAAEEMRNRVVNLVGFGSDGIWVSTFHSLCVRILRRYIDKLGYTTNFTIYDSEDSKSLIKNLIKRVLPGTDSLKPQTAYSAISSAKNEMISSSALFAKAGNFYDKKNIARIYEQYEIELKKNNALDFDDLLIKCLELFATHEEILLNYQERFKYIMVDEYQDTNMVQFELVRLLSEKNRNICVVGDDDQSIYRFRGADVRNIYKFESYFDPVKTIKLEQNYRSTSNILNTANSVISHNRGRKEKTLWSELGEGSKVEINGYCNQYKESEAVCESIRDSLATESVKFGDFAVLYRINAQSRVLEEKLISCNIPYRIFGAVNFYQRMEIKDILGYLKIINNEKDDLSLQRIINVPKRGIGQTTLNKAMEYASLHQKTLLQVLKEANSIQEFKNSRKKITLFVEELEKLIDYSKEYPPSLLIKKIIDDTGYIEKLDEEENKRDQREENIKEFVSKAAEFEKSLKERNPDNNETDKRAVLNSFLEDVSLISDIDNYDEASGFVSLMTIHAAKGLEFPHVFITGMEEGVFPGFKSINSGKKEDIEEERRLCYVGFTRAKKKLTLSFCDEIMINGNYEKCLPSRFLHETDKRFIDYHYYGFNKTDFFGKNKNDKKTSVSTGRDDTAGYSQTAEGTRVESAYFKRKREYMSTLEKSVGTYGKAFIIKKSSSLDYEIGDRVKHSKFGLGTVLDIENGKKDFEVTIDFDKEGTKRMLASFAKLEKEG